MPARAVTRRTLHTPPGCSQPGWWASARNREPRPLARHVQCPSVMPLVKQKGMVPLGEVIAKIYEEAEKVVPDRRRASRLAANAVARLLVRTGNVRAARKLAA